MEKKFLVFLTLASLILACGNSLEQSGETEKSAENGTEVATTPDGEKIYKTYCIACHGLYGDMGASGAANLQESKLQLEERILVIAKGRNTMAPFESLLSEEKIKAVAAFTTTLKKSE